MDKRLLRIKEKLLTNNCDGYIVTNDSEIRYISGLKSSNILLLITNNKSYVLSDGRYKYMIERQEIFEPVCVTKSIIESVCDLVKELNLKKVMIDPEYINHKNYKKLSEKINLVDCENITKELRIVKTKEEIENIKKAQEISEKAFLYVLKTIKAGDTTSKIASLLNYKMNELGSEEPAFSTIVVNEEESADCHGVPSNKKICDGDFILFDFGATYNGYRSDMTRTVAFGTVNEEKKKIYDIVYNAHILSSKALKPGVKCSDIDKIARDYIESFSYKDYFIHSLGHGVGIDIHEFPTLSAKSEDVLKEGMVVTVEPGLYFKNKFGIRIEDTYIITNNGAESIAKIDKNLIII
ncbi:MAG: aminopeptidase P family protein [Ruminococcaceae bacterium]|nr:aminopeptidase P family protein [Oscillospiraceae bacterium]